MDANFYCVNEACARPFPRRVAFCPFCGVNQSAPPLAPRPAAPPEPAAAPVAAPLAKPLAELIGQSAEAAAEPVARLADDRPAGLSAASPAPAPEAALAAVAAGPASPVPPAPPTGPDGAKSAGTAAPPLAPPIRMRTWLLVLLALGAIWLWAKPRSQDRQVEARVDQAIALSGDCRLDAARVELTRLKSGKATPEQLRRVQSAIGESGPVCEKKRLRGKAWREAAGAVEHGLSEAAYEQAEHRLAQFTRRWGADAETRELDGRIAAARGTLLLDEAEACRRKGDPLCMEQRLAAAEGLHRPELAPRAAALRESLASLLHSHKAAASDALASAPSADPTRPADDPAAPGADGADTAPAPAADAMPAALESKPPEAVVAAPAALAPIRAPGARAKPPLAVAVIAAPAARVRPAAPKAKPAAQPRVAVAVQPRVAVAAAPPAPRVRPTPHRARPVAPPAAPQLAARRPAPLVSPTPPALVSRPPAPQIFISKPSAMIAAVPAPQYARRLLADAGHDMELGNYRAAIDKLEICATMIDAGNRECQALRRRAERLNRDMLRCVASGAEWADEQCQ